MKYAPYSYSKLTTFEGCPARFKLQYIDKIKVETKSPALIKGSNVHEILEHFGTNKLDDSEASNVVRKFIKSNVAKRYLKALCGIEKSKREISVGLYNSENGVQSTAYDDPSAFFRGKIDFICNVDGVLNLCDYKTGKYKEEIYQDYRQLMFYAIYFFIKYNIDKIRISYVYVEHDMENVMLLERKYLSNYLNTLNKMINSVESATEFPKITKFCKWCDYALVCSKNCVENRTECTKN